MKSNATGKPLGTALNKLRALADADIATDDETPYDPERPAAVGRSGAMPRSRRAVGWQRRWRHCTGRADPA